MTLSRPVCGRDATQVALVLGVCPPERHRITRLLSTGAVRAEIGEEVPAHAVPSRLEYLLGDRPSPDRVVIECPSSASSADLIAQFTSGSVSFDPHVRLGHVVTVVDASHLIPDLGRRDYVHGEEGRPPGVSWAQVTVTQIENATVIPIVSWRHLARTQLNELLALLSHLNPTARLKLIGSGWARQVNLDWRAPEVSGGTSGWRGILRDRHDPPFQDPRVSSFCYEQVRPLHPQRVAQMLRDQVDRDEAGHIVRSVGLCRFAPQPALVGQWDQVGSIVTFAPLAADTARAGQSIGQRIAITGFDLNPNLIRSRLDLCALTDDELAVGPAVWRRYSDPLVGSPGH